MVKKKKPSDWMRLNRIDRIKGLEQIWVQKSKVDYISRTRVNGEGFTCLEYRDKWNRKKMVSVLEDPQHIMGKIAY